MINSDEHEKLKPGLQWKKQHSARRSLFTSKLDLNLREKFKKNSTFGVKLFMVLKIGHFGK